MTFPPRRSACARLERELGVSARWRRCWSAAGSPTRRRRGRSWRPRTRTTRRASRASRRRSSSSSAHVGRRSRIVVHGDYDVRRRLLHRDPRAHAARARRRRRAGSSRAAPTTATGSRRPRSSALAARGTRLLVTADCAITAVEEVARARALGIDVRRDRPPPAARRRRAARRADRAPGSSAATRARSCARRASRTSSRRRCCGRRRPRPGATARRSTSTSSRSRRSPTACRCAARTAASCARGSRARAHARPGLRALLRVAQVDPPRDRRADASASGSRRGSTPRAACSAPTPASSCC